jgi:hypothetical protein
LGTGGTEIDQVRRRVGARNLLHRKRGSVGAGIAGLNTSYAWLQAVFGAGEKPVEAVETMQRG